MSEEALYLNEEQLGDLSVDQRLEGRKDEEHIHMARPYSSLYTFEYAIGSLLADSHAELCLEEDPELQDFNFGDLSLVLQICFRVEVKFFK